jgi:nucleoside-diphosphate-sugar epimerase
VYVRALVRNESARAVLPDTVALAITDDLAQSEGIERALSGADAVIHLAARVPAEGTETEDTIFLHTNAFITERVVRAAARAGVRRFIYVSSAKAVGERSGVDSWNEDTKPQPSEAYGRSKLIGEKLARTLGAELEMEVVIVRPPMVFGPGVGGNFRQLIALARIGHWIPLPLAGISNRRSTLFVHNLADALVLLSHHPAAAGQTFFISDGTARSTPDIVRAMGAARGANARLFRVSQSALIAMARFARLGSRMEKLCASLEVDDARLRRITGWAPPFSFDEAIRLAVVPGTSLVTSRAPE